MSIQLYEEAIADARHIMSLAEDNAKRAIIAAVQPQITKLIESHIMDGPNGLDMGDDADDNNVTTDIVPPTGTVDPVGAAAITPPGPDGKVTLDLDALDGCVVAAEQSVDEVRPACDTVASGEPDDEFVLNAESIAALEPVMSGIRRFTENEVELQTYRLGEAIAMFSRAGRAVCASRGYAAKIKEMISRVRNTYECVQESVKDSTKRRLLERKLEAFNRALVRLTESQMSIRRGSVNEGDITLKLTGVPDEIDLDSVGVDLVKDEGGDDGDVDGSDQDQDQDLDLDLDGGGDEGGNDDLDLSGGNDDDEKKKMGEGRRLSDSTVVEIDEGMLRREISRMRAIREEAVPSTNGHALRSNDLDDFGDGSDEGDAWLDSDVSKGGTSVNVVGESDMPDEEDDVLEIDMGNGDDGNKCDDTPMGESRAKIRRERQLQERLATRMIALKNVGRRARSAGNADKLAEASAAFKQASRQLRESQRRVNKLKGSLAETARASRMWVRSNSDSRLPAERKAASQDLRNQVSQLNLRNARLTATTKLLQNESLTPQQRADIVEQLETATSPREVKLVYESLMKAHGRSSRTLAEGQGRVVRGSASRATRSAMSTLNESTEAARWAQLAGIR